jgi:murein DD-endopeptidase MepM/ murein hydrolase activator NlpD
MAIHLLYPVIGPVTQLFGENPQFYVKWGYPGHNGVDFGIPNGMPVKAAAGGKVDKVSFEEGGYGKYIKLRHSDGDTTYYTYYAHLISTDVSSGQSVGVGTVIGHSNNTGASTGPHLHFGLKIPGANPSFKDYVDPMPLLSHVTDDSGESFEPGAPEAFVDAVDIPALKFEVTHDTLNVRSGPGIQYPVVDQLSQGAGFSGKRLHSAGLWVEIEPGKWCALSFQGLTYLKVKK